MALGPGDLVFVGWDSDNDDVTFLVTAPIASGEVIFFTDDEWNGTEFIGREQLIEWEVPAGGLEIGEVITINQNGGGGPVADRAIVEDENGVPVGDTTYIRGGGQMAPGNEMFWAFQGTVDGTGTVTQVDNFIAVIGNEADGGNTQTPNLTNTGLTTSTGAVIIDGDEDYMEFAQDADVFGNQAQLLAAVGDPGNWVTADGGGNNNPNGEGFDLDFVNIYCFTPGAMIDTPEGPRAVEEIGPGDLVTTRDHGPRPVRFVARRLLKAKELEEAPHLRPIVIRAGALGPGSPNADLKVSPQHRMLLSGRQAALLFGEAEVFAPAMSLVNDKMVRVARGAKKADYIHLLFDRHEVIFANGAATESLNPSAGVVDGMQAASRDELLEIFPELRLQGGRFRPRLARPGLRRYEGAVLGRAAVARRNRRG